jgi:stearoyl-CoA desaturase (delta-9 desaturase)
MAIIRGGQMNNKIKLLQLFNFVFAILGFIYVFYTQDYSWLLVSLLCWFFIGPIAVVIGLHRMLSHRSFKTYKWVENTLCILSVYSSVGPTINWVALHRVHHQHSDMDLDPHSPYDGGMFSFKKAVEVWFGFNWKVTHISIDYAKDLVRDPLHRFIYRHYFSIILGTCLGLLVLNPLLVMYCYIIPAMMTYIIIGMVNVLGHFHGYRNHDKYDMSTNSWIANLFSLGDGWHNNHHNNPQRYYSGERWYEWDLMGSIIKVIKV